MAEFTERLELRLDSSLIEKLDFWRSSQRGLPTRSEAIRRLIEEGITVENPSEPKVSNSERLILWLLTDLLKINPNYDDSESLKIIQQALLGGHLWALDWHFTGLLHGHTDKKSELDFVLKTMSMWRQIERDRDALSETERTKLVAKIGDYRAESVFEGFDGNTEGELKSIAHFLVAEMGRFDEFQGRTLNSHTENSKRYEKMLAIYANIEKGLGGKTLNSEDLAMLLA